VRQLSTERLQDIESLGSAAATAKGGTEDEAGSRVRRIGVQNFPGLICGEIGIFLKEPFRMGNCHVDRPKGL
jgi:hypothetical protein